jgi:hypothetical protein
VTATVSIHHVLILVVRLKGKTKSERKQIKLESEFRQEIKMWHLNLTVDACRKGTSWQKKNVKTEKATAKNFPEGS